MQLTASFRVKAVRSTRENKKNNQQRKITFKNILVSLKTGLKKMLPAAAEHSKFMNTNSVNDLEIIINVRPPLPIDSIDSQLFPYQIQHQSTAAIFSLLTAKLQYRVNNIYEASYDDGGTPPPVLLDMFNRHVQPLLALAKKGGGAVVFAYGQTSAGKTFTMTRQLQLISQHLFSSASGDYGGEVYLSAVQLLGTPKRPNSVVDLSNGFSVQPMEEFTGKVAIKNLTEHLVRNQQEFQSIISMLFESRRSQSTKRNDQSSRSHALFRLRFARPPSLKGIAIEDGLLWMVDLAGSENANDSSQHDQLLFEQTKLINQSLMCLRDCIRAREMLLAPGNTTSAPAKHVHIPFRQSPLTFLLREVFDPHIALRPIRTLAIGCITPLNCDASQSRSTLRYMETLWKTRSRCSGRRDCATAEERFTTVPYDPMNPVTWAADKLAGWIIQTTGGLIEPHDLMRNDCQTGLDILRLPEQEFIERCMQANPRLMTEKRAKAFYMKLWKLGADQRRRQQKERMKPRPPKQNNETPPTPLTQNNEPS